MLRERTQCILTNSDYERVRECLKRFGGSKLYICYNEHPWETLKDHVREVELKTLEILARYAYVTQEEEEKFREAINKRFESLENASQRVINYKTDRIEWVPVNYYNFEDSLVTLFDLSYLEYLNGRDMIVGINGGIRLTAVAASFAAGLLPNCHLVYFFSNQWGISPEGGISRLILGKEPVKISPIFNISLIVPSQKEEVLILITLLHNEEELTACRSVKRIVSYAMQNLLGIKLTKRSKITKSQIARYTNKLKTLMKNGLAEREDNIIKLTENGKLIAKLVEKRFIRDQESQRMRGN